MPVYLYQEILPDGTDGERFEIAQRMSDPPLTRHPTTGYPVRKIFQAPHLPNKYTEAATRSKLTDANVEKHGFTKYEKDKVTGLYHKTAGKDKRAPETVNASKLKALRDKGVF